MTEKVKLLNKNPVYERHQISRQMRIKSPLLLKYIFGGVGSGWVGLGQVGLGWVGSGRGGGHYGPFNSLSLWLNKNLTFIRQDNVGLFFYEFL